jgi:menaquinone-dependent protoporphyrinogen oxidase
MRNCRRSTRCIHPVSALITLAACASAAIPASSVHYEGGPATTRRALVLYATRAGSTAEVADRIGRKLSEAGWSVDVGSVKTAGDLRGYQAVVIGSAIRMGSVLPEIREFVQARRAELKRLPVAYFVVCMTMQEDTPENRAEANSYLDPLRSAVKPVEVGLFAGEVDYSKLGAGTRLMARMADLPAGDYRDWTAIETWARALAAKLGASAPPQDLGTLARIPQSR